MPENNNQRPKPLMMIPVRRCGSHALRLRLNFSEEFYSPYPLHICDVMHLLPFYGDLADDRQYFQLVIDIIGLQNATMVKWDKVALDPVAVFESIRDQPRSIHAVLWEMLFQAGEQFGAKVVMDKSLDSVAWAEDLFAIHPDMLLLNVVRDPRAQVASMNRAILYDFDTLGNTLRWQKAHDLARQLMARYPTQVLTIRFEDFIHNQAEVLFQICQFLGIEFSEKMLEVGKSREACNISRLSSLWQSNAFNPVPGNIDKFKKDLSMDEIRLIETLTAEHMEYYGYERMSTADSSKPTAADIQAAALRSEKNKREAWKKLERENYKDYHLRQFRQEYIHRLETRLMGKSGIET